MVLHRANFYHQGLSNFLVGKIFAEQLEYFQFSGGQPGRFNYPGFQIGKHSRQLRNPLHQGASYLRGNQSLALLCGLDSCNHIIDRVILEYVANCSSLHKLQHTLLMICNPQN